MVNLEKDFPGGISIAIRSSAKGLIVRDNKLLLIRCERGDKVYFTLPGGGQDPQESLEQTVIRECLEETGFTVQVGSLAFVLEEIITDPESIAKYPDYCHHHMWYFRRCRSSIYRVHHS